eukprot:g5772.t1
MFLLFTAFLLLISFIDAKSQHEKVRSTARYNALQLKGEEKFSALKRLLFPMEEGDLVTAQDYWNVAKILVKERLYGEAAFHMSTALHLDTFSRTQNRNLLSRLEKNTDNFKLCYREWSPLYADRDGNDSGIAEASSGYPDTYGAALTHQFVQVRRDVPLIGEDAMNLSVTLTMFSHNTKDSSLRISANLSALKYFHRATRDGDAKLDHNNAQMYNWLKHNFKDLFQRRAPDLTSKGFEEMTICSSSSIYERFFQNYNEAILLLRQNIWTSLNPYVMKLHILDKAISFLKVSEKVHPYFDPQRIEFKKQYKRSASIVLTTLGAALYCKASGLNWSVVASDRPWIFDFGFKKSKEINEKEYEYSTDERISAAMESLLYLQRALALDENDTFAQFLLGRIKIEIQNIKGSEKQIQEFMKLPSQRLLQAVKSQHEYPLPSVTKLLSSSVVAAGNHPWLILQREYLKRHLDLMEKASTPGALQASDIRIVICPLPFVGFGNQLTQLISTMALTLVATKRVMLVKFSKRRVSKGMSDNFENHIRFPGDFTNDETTEKTKLIWKFHEFYKLAASNGNGEALADLVDVEKSQQLFTGMMEEHYLQDPKFVEALSCAEDIEESLGGANKLLVYIRSNLTFLSLLEQNPFYYDRVDEIFEGDMFGRVTKFILKPSHEVEKIINDFERKHYEGKSDAGLLSVKYSEFGKLNLPKEQIHPRWMVNEVASGGKGGGTLVVGLHLRFGMTDNSIDTQALWTGKDNEDTVNRMLEEALLQLPQILRNEKSKTLPKGVKPFEKVMVYLAADTMRVKMLAKQQLEAMDEVDEVVFYTSELTRNSDDGMKHAVVDMMLLGKSHILARVGKHLSLFSLIVEGLMKGRLSPVYKTQGDRYGSYAAGQSKALQIVKSVLTGHTEDIGTCYGGKEGLSEHLYNVGVLYPYDFRFHKSDQVSWAGDAIRIASGRRGRNLFEEGSEIVAYHHDGSEL